MTQQVISGTNYLGNSTIEGQFFYAVVKGNFDTALKLEVSPDLIIDNQGKPFLFLSIEHDAPKVAKFLLENGADANIQYNGMTPLDYAAKIGSNIGDLVKEYGGFTSDEYFHILPVTGDDHATHIAIADCSNEEHNTADTLILPIEVADTF